MDRTLSTLQGPTANGTKKRYDHWNSISFKMSTKRVVRQPAFDRQYINYAVGP